MAVAERPELRIAPSRIGLTGLRSYFWLDHVPPTVWATASVPGVLVTAEARPVRYGWNFGEGHALTTANIGRAWSRRVPGSISHLYERRGHYPVEVQVVWEARWRIGAGPWTHLGYFSNSTARDYPVRQMVGRLTRRSY
ncbi:MAG: PKD domain-containing protein [Actinomycetota bacterium]